MTRDADGLDRLNESRAARERLDYYDRLLANSPKDDAKTRKLRAQIERQRSHLGLDDGQPAELSALSPTAADLLQKMRDDAQE